MSRPEGVVAQLCLRGIHIVNPCGWTGGMNKPSAARYRTTNWPSYTAAPRKCGSLLIRLDKEMTWLALHDDSYGRPSVFSDSAIQF
jgi:hypothetical protein